MKTKLVMDLNVDPVLRPNHELDASLRNMHTFQASNERTSGGLLFSDTHVSERYFHARQIAL